MSREISKAKQLNSIHQARTIELTKINVNGLHCLKILENMNYPTFQNHRCAFRPLTTRNNALISSNIIDIPCPNSPNERRKKNKQLLNINMTSKARNDEIQRVRKSSLNMPERACHVLSRQKDAPAAGRVLPGTARSPGTVFSRSVGMKIAEPFSLFFLENVQNKWNSLKGSQKFKCRNALSSAE